MISAISFTNYGCLASVTIPLTPLHALIGPNDTGKSTVLRGIAALKQALVGRPWDDRLLLSSSMRNPARVQADVGGTRVHIEAVQGSLQVGKFRF